MLKTLAFDFGASSGRAMLSEFDGKKITLKEIHRFSNDPVTFKGTLYWDALRIMHEMNASLIKCKREGHHDIKSVASDTWGVDYGLLDKKGSLISNPVHYRDKRTDNMQELASKIIGNAEFYEHTGIQFMKLNTVYQLLAMKMTDKETLDRASTLLFMPDLFNYYLCGEKLCEYSIASTSQMLNARKRDWDNDILSKLGIDRKMLLDVVPSGTIAGTLTDDLCCLTGLGNVKVIAVGGHDTASAVLAVPSKNKNFAYISSGTWSLLGTERTEPVINEKTYRMNYTNEGGFGNTIRLLKNIMGLWILQECKRQWEIDEGAIHFDVLDAEAEAAEPFYTFIDPDHPVFYEPGNMPERIVAYCKEKNQKVPQTKGQITRCIMESLAMKYRYALDALEDVTGVKFDCLNVVGGGCKNKILLKFTASAIGRPVMAGPIEATAAGNIMGQLISLGEVNGISQAREIIARSFDHVDYQPIQADQWNEAYDRFLNVTGLKGD